MSYCASCGTAIPAGGAFCGQCGHRVGSPIAAAPAPAATPAATIPSTVATGPTPTPPPPPQPRNRAMPIIIVLALALVGAGIIVLATHKSDSKSGADTGVTTTLVGDTTVPGTDGSTTAPASTAPADPATQLQQMALADKPTADSLVGKVVVQLSAKKVGLTVGGITYGPAEILGDHLKLRSAYGAILVDAGAYQFTSGGQPMTGWYLTIVSTPFANKAAADQWCTDHGMGPSDCFSRTFKPPK